MRAAPREGAALDGLRELLDRERDAEWMQHVAAEMNLSETAFLLRREDGWSLRWFTPAVEVDLCGHATLASAHALWEEGLGVDPVNTEAISFLAAAMWRSRDSLIAFRDGLMAAVGLRSIICCKASAWSIRLKRPS